MMLTILKGQVYCPGKFMIQYLGDEVPSAGGRKSPPP